MVIDCERCEVRGIACGDCVIGVSWGCPAFPPAVLDGPEEALAVDRRARRQYSSTHRSSGPSPCSPTRDSCPGCGWCRSARRVTDGNHDGEKVRDVG